MTDDHDVAPMTNDRRRPRWQWVGPVAGAIALIVAVGQWVVPEVGGWVCDKIGYRLLRCNEVPGDLLGTWTGTETCKSQSVIVVCEESQYVFSVVIRRGKSGQDIVASKSEMDGESTCESDWALTAVGDNPPTLHIHKSRLSKSDTEDPSDPMRLTGCPADLDATLRLTDQHTLQMVSRSGPTTAPLLPAGLTLFTADLRKT